MGDGDHGAGILLQMFFQPGHRFGVEMVGWLVKQENVRSLEQQPTERNAALFTAGENRN